MRLLLLTSSANALTARLRMELVDDGHAVEVHVVGRDETDAHLTAVVEGARPDLVIAPTLTRILPESVWRPRPCLIVHPGIRGDRGRSSLDWAIQEGESTWGVTLLQAQADVDGGDVWAWREFAMRPASKTSLYRHEVSTAAVACVHEAVVAFARGGRGRPLASYGGDARGRFRRAMSQASRAIDWEHDDTETIVRKVRAADTAPGVRCEMLGADVYVHGAHREERIRVGRPGQVFARRHGALCVATRDGAVWLTHARAAEPGALKLPAMRVLGAPAAALPEIIAGAMRPSSAAATFQDIWYDEVGEVGCIHFDVYNGALSTEQCLRLCSVIRAARARPTKVIVLMGGTDFFCNGIHLAAIEAASNPALESWANIVAIDDVVLELIETTSHLVVASLGADAAAGGMIMALAADRVYARHGVVMNPHYRALALYGSEYWTYLLPRRVGEAQARALTEGAAPVGPRAALAMGLIDGTCGESLAEHRARVLVEAHRLARDGAPFLRAKQARRARDEAAKPLAAYREAELREMRSIFENPAARYHASRRHFLRPLA